MKRFARSGWWRWAAPVWLAGLLAGCTSGDAVVGPAAGTATGIESNAVVWLTPKAILEDVVHPPGQTRQRFTLVDRFMTWHVDFPAEGNAFAGFVLRTTNDLSRLREHGSLRLRLQPAHEARQYRAALVDANGTQVSLPIAKQNPAYGSGWLGISLPLREFPDRGLMVRDDTFQTGVTFDWSKVREFRLITNGRRMSPRLEIGVLRVVEE